MSGKEDESLTPEEWALVNAILYAEEDAKQIRQIVQSYKIKRDANDKSVALFLFSLGEKLFTRENVSSATKLYSACILLDPSFVDAYLRKAETLDWREDFDKEREFLETAVERFPNRSDLLRELANLLDLQHDYSGAAAHYKKMLEINPQDGETYLKLLQFLTDHQMNSKITRLVDEIPIPPLTPRDLFRVFNFFVFAFEATQLYERALEFADKALKYKPKRIALWEKKAKIYTALKQYSKALQCYNQMILIKPQAKKYQDIRDKFVSKHKLSFG
ncbi:MAG: hypothetical protein RBG13Loki_1207 [Promethearchaeota archaeon CR_4]|nr:MAG: hypothetical protein RBG13Loki_1207 [Candidatus Lokiarchaeota archaeon CR_4]